MLRRQTWTLRSELASRCFHGADTGARHRHPGATAVPSGQPKREGPRENGTYRRRQQNVRDDPRRTSSRTEAPLPRFGRPAPRSGRGDASKPRPLLSFLIVILVLIHCGPRNFFIRKKANTYEALGLK